MGLLASVGRALGVARVVLRRADLTTAGSGASVMPALVERLRELAPDQTRLVTNDTYFEGVILRERVADFQAVVTDALGEPAKAIGVRAAFEDDLERLVDSRGGIDKGQCLHLRCFSDDGSVAFAAFWPWSDGKHVTLKAGLYD
jgi:hypothetical protein